MEKPKVPFQVTGAQGGNDPAMYKNVELAPGVLMAQVDFISSAKDIFEVQVLDAMLEFSFHISGRALGHLSSGRDTYETVSISPATSLISYNPNATCKVQMEEGQRFKALNVYMPPWLLGDIMGKDLGGAPDVLKKIALGGRVSPFNIMDRLDPAMIMISDQIMNCRLSGAARRLYMQGKALELISCRLARFERGGKPADRVKRLSPREMLLVREAKEHLLANLDNPPSLAALARRVGMNAARLSQGFRSVYGSTAFNFLRKERIMRAKDALGARKMNITETAHHFGYSDASHFIREFVRFFGTTPGNYLKTLG